MSSLSEGNRNSTATIAACRLALSTARPNSYFNLYQVGNNVYLNYAIPEPSTYALMGLGALALVIAVRRRKA